MEKKYKNAKTTYKKLSDDQKIDFLLSRIDKVTSHANNLVKDIDDKVSKKGPSTLKEKFQKGYIKISFSHKRLWDERVSIDKLFSGSNPALNKELSSLYSVEIKIKQTKNAPEIYKLSGGAIVIDFLRDIKKSELLIQRMFLDTFFKDYIPFLINKIDINWNIDSMKNFCISFVQSLNLIFVNKNTQTHQILQVLKLTIGLSSNDIYSPHFSYSWEECFYRIIQIGAIARLKKELTELEKYAEGALSVFEEKLIKKLERRL